MRVCDSCHRVEAAYAVPLTTPSYLDHLRCLKQEIMEAQKAGDEDRRLRCRIEDARVHDDGRAWIRAQVIEGDPRSVQGGSTVEGELVVGRKGVDRQATVVVKQRSRSALRLQVDTGSWGTLQAGSELFLLPRSDATLARTLLQAFLLARRIDETASDLEHPREFPRIGRRLPDVPVGNLNASQARAVRAAAGLPEQGLLMVQGPPGTGKTTVIAQAIRNAVQAGQSVLVTSHTHIAIDNALRKTLSSNPLMASRMVRLGEPKSVATDLLHLNRQIGEFAMVGPEDERRRPMFAGVYDEAPVVGMTLDALAAALVRYRDHDLQPFDLVIVDEAGMNLHPKLAIAHAAGRRLMLVGDHEQLPPIVTAPGFRNDPSYCRSPFEALQAARGDLLILLDEQYRCQPAIYEWSADAVYGGKVHSRTTETPCLGSILERPVRSSVVWLDTAAASPTINRDEKLGRSWINRFQIAASLRVIEELVRTHRFDASEIGYISPFRAQADLFAETLEATRLLGPVGDITASTVDAFQGSERRIILYDLTTRVPRKPHADHRRLNVSLTRAQDQLFILGPRSFAVEPASNPWYWSLQNWHAAQVIPFEGHLVPDAFMRAIQPRPVAAPGRAAVKPV